MPRRIDYYFSLISPWAYIGHSIFMDLARGHGAAVTYKPVLLGDVFAETGGLPLSKRPPVRRRYRILELQRWREKRGLKFNIHPKFWPFNVELADRFAVAIIKGGHDPDVFLRRAFAAIWEDDQNLADGQTIARIADQAGLPGSKLLSEAGDYGTKAVYDQNIQDAISAGVFGSPGYVLDGEVFWGQDRIELLADALASNRKAYRIDA